MTLYERRINALKSDMNTLDLYFDDFERKVYDETTRLEGAIGPCPRKHMMVLEMREALNRYRDDVDATIEKYRTVNSKELARNDTS